MIKRGSKLRESGQVWIETIIYTLIGFVIIGLVLNFAMPPIQCMQDKAIIQQSTDMMKTIDLTILDMSGAGNQRLRPITLNKGDLKLDCINNQIIFEIKTGSGCLYSEPGKNVSDGNIIALTKKITGNNLVTLTRDYSPGYNFTFNGEKILKVITHASNPYKLTILNRGVDANGKIILDMSL